MIPPQQQPSTASMKPRGAFVLLEGVDRCGKTTQCKRLVERLISAGIAATLMRFPDRTTSTGMIINDYLTQQSSTNALDDHAIHLLFSANRWESASTIVQHLRNGTTVVCDRYVYSGVAFSASKIKTPPSLSSSLPNTDSENVTVETTTTTTIDDEQEEQAILDLEWCKASDRGLPAPDCVFFLDVSPEVAEQRGGYGGERYEKRDIQQRVRKQFNILRDDDQKHIGNDNHVPWSMIDAGQSIEDVSSTIWDTVQPIIQASMNKPISKIWQEGYYEEL